MNIEAYTARGREQKQVLTDFLDGLPQPAPAAFEGFVAAADAMVWRDIDCTMCANCCKTMTPIFTTADISRIATHLRLSPAAFRKKWLVKNEAGEWGNIARPCQFLDGNMCSIYEIRPADCAGFPHHDKKPFDTYKVTFKNNLVHCPATLTLVERLQKLIEGEIELL